MKELITDSIPEHSKEPHWQLHTSHMACIYMLLQLCDSCNALIEVLDCKANTVTCIHLQRRPCREVAELHTHKWRTVAMAMVGIVVCVIYSSTAVAVLTRGPLDGQTTDLLQCWTYKLYVNRPWVIITAVYDAYTVDHDVYTWSKLGCKMMLHL